MMKEHVFTTTPESKLEQSLIESYYTSGECMKCGSLMPRVFDLILEIRPPYIEEGSNSWDTREPFRFCASCNWGVAHKKEVSQI